MAEQQEFENNYDECVNDNDVVGDDNFDGNGVGAVDDTVDDNDDEDDDDDDVCNNISDDVVNDTLTDVVTDAVNDYDNVEEVEEDGYERDEARMDDDYEDETPPVRVMDESIIKMALKQLLELNAENLV